MEKVSKVMMLIFFLLFMTPVAELNNPQAVGVPLKSQTSANQK